MIRLLAFLMAIGFPAIATAERLPDGGIAEAMGLKAWYEDPTDRYAHAVLGDALEAATLAVQTGDTVLRVTLPRNQVFEDITPRIVDADGDGTPEVLAIKAYDDAGATITLYGLRDGALRDVAEAPAIGTPNRWLNPAGVADYDGDGAPEIAVIRTPHIGGILILYRWDGVSRDIVELRRTRGYSTHAIGSRALGLALTEDWNGDDVPDLLLPNQRRDTLIAVSMAGGGFEEIDRYKMRREITGDLELLGNFVRVPLEGGLARTVTRPYPDGKAK
jgi:hypothetical protein